MMLDGLMYSGHWGQLWLLYKECGRPELAEHVCMQRDRLQARSLAMSNCQYCSLCWSEFN